MTTVTNLETMEVEVSPVFAATLTATCKPDPMEIGRATREAFETLAAFVKRHRLTTAGPPRTIYATHDPTAITFTAACPVLEPVSIPGEGAVQLKRLDGARALRVVHRGPYESLRETYASIDHWLRERGGLRTDADWARYMPMWEEYLNDPATTPPADLVTQIYLTLP